VTATRTAQKRGDGATAKPGSRRAISAGLSTVIRSPRADRQPPGRKLGGAFGDVFEETAMHRRLRRRHHHLDHAQGAVGVALILRLPE
jgi:hypothetical protein